MPHYRARVTSSLPPEEAFAYMAHFENTREWDPGITRADPRRPGAEPGPGTEYEVDFRFNDRVQTIVYRVVEIDAPHRIVLVGDAPRYSVRDTITVEPDGTGSAVTYEARITLRGVLKLAGPLVQRGFRKAGDAAIAGLRPRLNP